MRKVKSIIFGVVIGLAVGLWFGVNIGKNRSIFSNHFADRDLKQQAEDAASEVIKDTKDAIRKSLN